MHLWAAAAGVDIFLQHPGNFNFCRRRHYFTQEIPTFCFPSCPSQVSTLLSLGFPHKREWGICSPQHFMELLSRGLGWEGRRWTPGHGEETQRHRLESRAVVKALQQVWPGEEPPSATGTSCNTSVLPTRVPTAKETPWRLSEQRDGAAWGARAGWPHPQQRTDGFFILIPMQITASFGGRICYWGF